MESIIGIAYGISILLLWVTVFYVGISINKLEESVKRDLGEIRTDLRIHGINKIKDLESEMEGKVFIYQGKKKDEKTNS
jgi:hypothetical protein